MIFYTLLIICSIFGVIEMIRIVEQKFLCEDEFIKSTIIVPISSDSISPEILLRSIISKNRWCYGKDCYKIILIDVGLDYEERKICNIIISENDNIEFCSNEHKIQLLNIINK